MASPWKFLSRLVSPRREQKLDNGTVDEAKPDQAAIAGPTGTVAEESASPADQPSGVEPPHQDPPDTISAETSPTDEAEGEVHDTPDSVGAYVAPVGLAPSVHPKTAVTIANDAGKPEPAVKGAVRKPRDRDRKIEADGVIAPVTPSVHTASDDPMHLDEEIGCSGSSW